MTRESAHTKALQARPKHSMTLDISGCYGHAGEPMPKVTVFVNSKKDDNDAIEAAHVAAAVRAKAHPELGEVDKQRLTQDPDFLTDMKTVEALWRAFRDAEEPELNAWPTPEYMKANLDSDQLGALLNVYNHVREKRGPRPWTISETWVEMIREACVQSAGDDLPEMPLSGFSREYLVDFVMHAMKQWDGERRLMLRTIEDLAPKDDSANQDQPDEERPAES